MVCQRITDIWTIFVISLRPHKGRNACSLSSFSWDIFNSTKAKIICPNQWCKTEQNRYLNKNLPQLFCRLIYHNCNAKVKSMTLCSLSLRDTVLPVMMATLDHKEQGNVSIKSLLIITRPSLVYFVSVTLIWPNEALTIIPLNSQHQENANKSFLIMITVRTKKNTLNKS